MKSTKIPGLSINFVQNIPNVITIGDDFAIFDQVSDLFFRERSLRSEVFIFSMCLHGEVTFELNMKRHQAIPGDMTIVRPNDMIQLIRQTEDFSGVFIAMDFSSSQDIISVIKNSISTYHRKRDFDYMHLDRSERLCILEYYHILKAKAADTGNAMRREIIINLMRALIYDILNILRRHSPQEDLSKKRYDHIFDLFIHQVSGLFRSHREVAFYADRLCLTPKYLSQMVKKATGHTAGEWIDHYVVLEAKALLQSTDMTIQEISQELHFPNQSFFGKYFKNITGTSPRKYRRE